MGDRILSLGLQRSVELLRPVLTGALLFLPAAALAEVQVTIDQRDHVVQGTNAAALVRSMNGNPVRGDHGNAYASIHPDFNLDVSTETQGGLCRAEVDIRLHFVLTLPKAANPGGMNARTRSAWNGFSDFARRHEAHHQASYTNCARSFVGKAERLSGKQCLSLAADIRKLFNQMKKDCEAVQRAYDRSQARILPGLRCSRWRGRSGGADERNFPVSIHRPYMDHLLRWPRFRRQATMIAIRRLILTLVLLLAAAPAVAAGQHPYERSRPAGAGAGGAVRAGQ